MNRKDIEFMCELLTHKQRDDLAKIIEKGLGELESTDTYGSYWNSVVSYYNIYLDTEKYLVAKNMSTDDKGIIFNTLLDIYPHTENNPEVVSLDFRILKDYPEELLNEKKLLKNQDNVVFDHEINIQYNFLLEQVRKAREKYKKEDYDGALTNLRSAIEAATFDIYKRVTGQEIVGTGSLSEDYKKVKTLLNLAPEKKTNNSAKKIVSSFISAIDGIDEIANNMGDRHLRKVKPSAHHTLFCLNATNTVLNFLYSSLIFQYREKDDIYSELIKILYKNEYRFLQKEKLILIPEIDFLYQRCDFFTKNILKNKHINEFEINHFKDSDVFFALINLFSETITKNDIKNIISKHSKNAQACGLKQFLEQNLALQSSEAGIMIDKETKNNKL